jgi:hypothetical protein
MAKSSKSTSKPAARKVAAPAKVVARSEVRNSPVPKASPVAATVKSAVAAAAPVVTRDAIARRAYEIWASGTGGSEFDNWVRAERELRGGL